MREILFRGKRHNGDWVFGNLFIPDKEDAPTEICIGTNVIRITYDVIPETVGEYTGLTDKNGKKIFEGDIVQQYGFCYVVSFENGSFVAYETPYNESAILPRTDWGNAVVVGNIHDNTELLKGGESDA